MSQNDTENVARRSHINPPVFFISAALIIVLVAFAALYPELADRKFKALQQGIFTNASWFYILAVALILLSVTYLGLSRYGNIKLGPDHAQPDFSYVSWFAMNLFFGSVLATISLTVPAVTIIATLTGQTLIFGLQAPHMVVMLTVLILCQISFSTGRTNVLNGTAHLALFAAYMLTIFA